MPRIMQKRAMDGALTKLVAKYVAHIVEAVRAEVQHAVAAQVQDMLAASEGRTGALGGLRARRRRILPCLAPSCKNPSKGPRFHYLCETHKDTPKKDYTAWREARKERAKVA